MQRAPAYPTLWQAIGVLQASSGLLDHLLAQCTRHYTARTRSSHAHAEPIRTNLGQICKEFQVFARRNDFKQAERLHEAYLRHGGEPKLWMVNTLIGMYARKRYVDRAFQHYEKLLHSENAGLAPNIFTYSNLLNALAKAVHPPYDLSPEVVAKAEAVFAEMVSRGIKPNQVVFHTLMDVQAKAALPDSAFATYRAMLAAGLPPSHTSFSILMAACGRAGDYHRAAEVMEKLMPQAGVKPTTIIWNSMLGAYAKSGSVDMAYDTWVRMLESGASPDGYTERALVDALSSHPSLAADVVGEARQIRLRMEAQQVQQKQQQATAEQEGEAGSPSSGASEGAASSPAAGTDVAGNTQSDIDVREGGGHDPERASRLRQGELLIDSFPTSTHSPLAGTVYGDQLYRSLSADVGQQPGPLDLEQLLYLDLHRMSQAAARASLLRRLEMLVNMASEIVAKVEAEQEELAAQQAQRALQQQTQHRERTGTAQRSRRRKEVDRQYALVVVTGVGRHSKEAGAGVLKAVVMELLQQHGVPVQEDPSNAGRLLVPWPGLRDFVCEQQQAMQKDHFFGVARARYTYIAMGVAGLMAASFILPRLSPWMPS